MGMKNTVYRGNYSETARIDRNRDRKAYGEGHDMKHHGEGKEYKAAEHGGHNESRAHPGKSIWEAPRSGPSPSFNED